MTKNIEIGPIYSKSKLFESVERKDKTLRRLDIQQIAHRICLKISNINYS